MAGISFLGHFFIFLGQILLFFQVIIFVNFSLINVHMYKIMIKYTCRLRRVTCWFCSRSQWVENNGFVCRSCVQYNGFGKDGGYNMEIAGQFKPELNPRFLVSTTRTSPRTSSSCPTLCGECNHKQVMKVNALAAFCPVDEWNFDREVEAYEKHLEDVYRLCGKCEGTLKRRLKSVQRQLVGTLAGRKGMRKPRGDVVVASSMGSGPNTNFWFFAGLILLAIGFNIYFLFFVGDKVTAMSQVVEDRLQLVQQVEDVLAHLSKAQEVFVKSVSSDKNVLKNVRRRGCGCRRK